MQLLFFHGDYCQSCKSMQDVSEQYAAQIGIPLYTFRVSDVYGGYSMAKQHHVRHVPCLILLDDTGKEQARTESAQTLETLHAAFDGYLKGGEMNE